MISYKNRLTNFKTIAMLNYSFSLEMFYLCLSFNKKKRNKKDSVRYKIKKIIINSKIKI